MLLIGTCWGRMQHFVVTATAQRRRFAPRWKSVPAPTRLSGGLAMKATILRVGLALVAICCGSHAGSCWRPTACLCETAAWAQLRPATIAPQATQAPQLNSSTLGTSAAGQGTSRHTQSDVQRCRTARSTGERGRLPHDGERQSPARRRTLPASEPPRGGPSSAPTRRRPRGSSGPPLRRRTNKPLPPWATYISPGGSAGTTVISKPPRVNDPRLAVGFEVPQAPTIKISAALTRQLRLIPGLPPGQSDRGVGGRRDCHVAGGVVASARDRTLAEQLVLFEPGISGVRNDLLVSPLPPTPETASPDRTIPDAAAGE